MARTLACVAAVALAACASPHFLESSENKPALVTPPPKPVELRKLHIALALGGGAARGFAHIGVIKALEARGIVPDIIVGTSAGSVVGALYASGLSGLELNRMALTMDESAISDWALPSRGILKGEGLQDFVNKTLNNRPIEKMTRRFAVVATDLHTGEMAVFERGNTGQAVRASSTVPGIFQPVRIGEHEYVDGGLVSPIPVRVARQMGADVVIAVDISSNPAFSDTSGMLGIMLQTFAIMGRTIGKYELEQADVVLRPELAGVKGTDFTARNSAVLSGEQVVASSAAQINAVLEKKRRELGAQ